MLSLASSSCIFDCIIYRMTPRFLNDFFLNWTPDLVIVTSNSHCKAVFTLFVQAGLLYYCSRQYLSILLTNLFFGFSLYYRCRRSSQNQIKQPLVWALINNCRNFQVHKQYQAVSTGMTLEFIGSLSIYQSPNMFWSKIKVGTIRDIYYGMLFFTKKMVLSFA